MNGVWKWVAGLAGMLLVGLIVGAAPGFMETEQEKTTRIDDRVVLHMAPLDGKLESIDKRLTNIEKYMSERLRAR